MGSRTRKVVIQRMRKREIQRQGNRLHLLLMAVIWVLIDHPPFCISNFFFFAKPGFYIPHNPVDTTPSCEPPSTYQLPPPQTIILPITPLFHTIPPSGSTLCCPTNITNRLSIYKSLPPMYYPIPPPKGPKGLSLACRSYTHPPGSGNDEGIVWVLVDLD